MECLVRQVSLKILARPSKNLIFKNKNPWDSEIMLMNEALLKQSTSNWCPYETPNCFWAKEERLPIPQKLCPRTLGPTVGHWWGISSQKTPSGLLTINPICLKSISLCFVRAASLRMQDKNWCQVGEEKPSWYVYTSIKTCVCRLTWKQIIGRFCCIIMKFALNKQTTVE